jgi:hypothetical protein
MAETPLMRMNGALGQMFATLKNSARWQLASMALNGIASGARNAVSYVRELNTSLNNIRIVTGMGVDEMARFADTANKAAKRLSTTTTDFTNASLIFYQ